MSGSTLLAADSSITFHEDSPVVLTLQSGRQGGRGGGTDTAKCREDIRGAHNHFTKIARVLIWRGGVSVIRGKYRYRVVIPTLKTRHFTTHWRLCPWLVKPFYSRKNVSLTIVCAENLHV